MALILCMLTAAVMVLKNGYSRDEVEHAAQNSLASIASAISSAGISGDGSSRSGADISGDDATRGQ